MTQSVDDLAEVTRYTIFVTQVCVPETWTDDQIVDFTNRMNPSGLENGWQIIREHRNGDPERNPCSERECFVHVALEC